MVRSSFISAIGFYKRYLSVLVGYGNCRFYPTCSEYALWNFENETTFRAFLKSIIRILKCNPMFSAGMDYPVVKKKIVLQNKFVLCKLNTMDVRQIKYWYILKKSDTFYVIKNFYYKDLAC